MRFPKTVRYRKAEARIYGKSKHYAFYRVCAYVAGKRRMASYRTYGEAKAAADKLVREIANGSQAAALTGGQATDALAALQTLDRFYQKTGKRLSLLGAVSEYWEAAGKLDGHSLGEAVDGFLSTVATVRRKDLAEAVEEIIEDRRKKTVAPREGKRPKISPEHHYNTSIWLRQFAKAFPGHAVCDLEKQHLDAYMSAYTGASPKTRNERRGIVKLFLRWCMEKDYLAATHRLFEAGGMKAEEDEPGDIEYYRPGELRLLLDNADEADEDLRPMILLAGLAGMRWREIIRLTWEECFATPGYIEVKASKSKTRSRRLITVCDSLAQWLEPYRGRTGRIWPKSYDMIHIGLATLREAVKVPNRENGLRHAFITYHYALHADEGLTAKEAGNSPDMIHKHYKALATKDQAQAWFAVSPARPANVITLAAGQAAVQPST